MSSVRGEKPKKPKVVYWWCCSLLIAHFPTTDRQTDLVLLVWVFVFVCAALHVIIQKCANSQQCTCCTALKVKDRHTCYTWVFFPFSHLQPPGTFSCWCSFPFSFFCFGALCSQFAFKKCVPANWANKNKLVCLHWRKHTHKWAIARIQINDVGMRRTLDSFTCDASEEGSKMRAKSVGKCLAVQDTVFPQRHPFDYHTSSTLNTQFKRPFLNWLDFLRFYSFDHHRHQ